MRAEYFRFVLPTSFRITIFIGIPIYSISVALAVKNIITSDIYSVVFVHEYGKYNIRTNRAAPNRCQRQRTRNELYVGIKKKKKNVNDIFYMRPM